MHPDFFRMLEYAARHIKQIVIFTNASLIDDNTAAKFKDHGVQVEVSLYGFNRESYESYVGITGAFRAFEKGLDLLKSYNVDCILKTSITNRNIQWLDKLKEYAYLKGCKYKFDPSTLIRMTLGNKKASKEERLSPSESASLLANDKNICKEVIRLIEQNSFNNDLYNCNGGITTCLISSDLHMSYCVAVREPYYDLHNNKSKLKEAHEWLMKQRIDKLMPNNKCFDCKYRPICRYCPGRFETETGSQRVPPQWNCDFGHILLSQALDNMLKEKG